MVSLHMPDVQVEIAWDSGYVTPAASRTWTDVSAYVELADRIDIGFGRQDERSTADANTLTLTLDNSDGRFTAGRAASPYYPNVKLGRPIRVTATPPGGTASVRFTGFVDEWPVEWDGTDAYARATIRASSRLARLGLTAKMLSMPEAAILASRPARYWTLGDASGSTTAAESSGNGGLSLSLFDNINNGAADAPVIFGNATGPPTDGLTAAEFSGGDPSGSPANGLQSRDPVGVPRAIRFTIKVNALGTGNYNVAGIESTAGQMVVHLTSAGVIRAGVDSSRVPMIGPNINDGATHDVTVLWDTTNAYFIVDGVQVGTSSVNISGVSFPTGTITRAFFGTTFSGVMSHAAIWDSANPLTIAQAQDQATSVLTGNAGERTDQRAVRLLGWAGVAATEVTTDTGVETMTYQQTSGQSVVDALRDAESTESGVLFDDRDGNVAFHNRSRRYLATAGVTLNMAAQHVGADYSPKLDRSTLLNDVEVSNPTTEEKARATSTASADEYGIATGTATSVADSYDPLQQKAAWLIASYAEPRSRVPSLTVDVLAHQGGLPSSQDLLALTVGDVIAVTNAPMQADTADTSYFVEGYTETIGPESYDISFNLSPSHPSLSTLALDSATRGLLDTGILAY